MKTIEEVRESFWNDHPEFRKHYRKTCRQNRYTNTIRIGLRESRQNQYNATIRTAWGFYVDMLASSGLISEELAKSATL